MCATMAMVVVAFMSTPVESNKFLLYGVLLNDLIPRQRSTNQPAKNFHRAFRPMAEPPLAPPPEEEGGGGGSDHHTSYGGFFSWGARWHWE